MDLLVGKGLVVRRENTEDRRFIRLELTVDGEELLSAIFRENRAWMEEKLSVLTQEQMALVIHALDLLKMTFED